MSFIENQGAKIYWDEQGQGEPVLLIMGLAYPSDAWYRTRPILAAKYRTIILDNRGVGRSDMPAGPYPIALMASDARAVLDAAGIQSAHVYGVSMGGMIAQEFTLQYPERVRSLILGCTAAGGSTAVQAKPEVAQMLMSRGIMTPDEAAEAAIPFIYDSGTPRARIDEDIAVRRPWFPRPEAYIAQLQGILAIRQPLLPETGCQQVHRKSRHPTSYKISLKRVSDLAKLSIEVVQTWIFQR
jgi:pimeloyl-ACP methyl ester carboxylesterase